MRIRAGSRISLSDLDRSHSDGQPKKKKNLHLPAMVSHRSLALVFALVATSSATPFVVLSPQQLAALQPAVIADALPATILESVTSPADSVLSGHNIVVPRQERKQLAQGSMDVGYGNLFPRANNPPAASASTVNVAPVAASNTPAANVAAAQSTAIIAPIPVSATTQKSSIRSDSPSSSLASTSATSSAASSTSYSTSAIATPTIVSAASASGNSTTPVDTSSLFSSGNNLFPLTVTVGVAICTL